MVYKWDSDEREKKGMNHTAPCYKDRGGKVSAEHLTISTYYRPLPGYTNAASAGSAGSKTGVK